MIAEGNYGQMEGVFLCLLSFARAKKVRRLPAVTGTTSTVQGLSPQLRGLSRISSLRHVAHPYKSRHNNYSQAGGSCD